MKVMRSEGIAQVALPGINVGKLNEKMIVALWCVAVWLVVMNTTMFNVALPSVIKGFGLSPSVASWVVTGYSIMFAVSTITYSRLSDYLPIRKLVVIGAFLMGVSSIVGYFSDSFVLLMLARIAQSLGAAVFPSVGLVLFSRYIPAERRGSAMSAIASSSALGFGMGPVIGGALTQYLGWNAVFVVTGMVLLLLPLLQRYIPMEEGKSVRIDYMGGLLIAMGITGLLLYLTTFTYLPLLVGIVGLGWFWRHIHRVELPFIQPQVIRNRAFTKLLTIGFVAFFLNFATLFCMPIMLTQMFGLDSLQTGLFIFPGAIVAAALTRPIGRAIEQYGTVAVIRIGLTFLMLSVVLFAVLSGLSPYGIMGSYLLMSVGFSILIASLSTETAIILPREHVGSGMGLNQLVSFFGGAFGIGITGTLLAYQKHLDPARIFLQVYLVMGVLMLIAIGMYLRYCKQKAQV